ncbi:MAG TPA: O-antigen ligase family protein, partial [Pirellulales bacterium]|nr:O-antigen ligase family protein [Pirellulales bacterium]
MHVERYYMIVTVICWLASRPSLPRGNRLHWSFAAFVMAMLASWMASPCGSTGDDTVENYLKFAVFYVVLVSTVRTEQDLRRILFGYLAVMTLWMAHCVREYNNGLATWAQGIKRLVPVGHSYDFNDFAGLIVCSLPFAWVLWREWTGWAARLLTVAYCGLAGYCIMLSGSRMGVVGIAMTVIVGCLASAKRWRLLAIAPVLAAVVWMMLPEDRRNRYLTLYDPDAGAASGAAASAGNYRSNGLVAALPLFEERPLLGYGPMGFMAKKGWLPHNLYGQLLAELGIAGAVSFASILLCVALNVVQARRIARD